MKLKRLSYAGYAGGLALGLGLVALYGAVEVSSTPGFCGSCHVMAPYFQSWQTSSHAEIACVECHIPPGVTHEIRKKYEAMAMVASYFTGTYGTNPWAEVDDSACLECHERRLLVGQELFGDILFDHGPHLTELRRGKRLQCTSCHSQIVQGSHIAVTPSTCLICHFKGEEQGADTARCTLCHQVPQKVLDVGGFEFDHSQVGRLGMDCAACHTPAGSDQGGVPKERCVTCHNDPERLAEYEDTTLLHQTHVTDHKVECTNCHLEIQHVQAQHALEDRSGCASCHGGGHSDQFTLYAGLGGEGVPPMPDVMFRAGVRCEGCHLARGEDRTSRAGEVSCMSCHGPAYRDLYLNWKSTVEERTTALRRQLDGSSRAMGSSPPTPFAAAEANLSLVERGHGIHNVPFSLALLSSAHRKLNEARQDRGLSSLSTPWPQAPYESPCLECHAGIEAAEGRIFGKPFSHASHVVGQGLACEGCHSTHEERDSGAAALKLRASDCASCHHGDRQRGCLDCHEGVLDRSFSVELGDFEHSFHVEEMELACDGCHGSGPVYRGSPGLEPCSDCH